MAMNALSLYVTTCRMIFQSDIEDNGAWADINRLVLYLRQALTCCVCGKLLTVPMSSTVSSCQHHVCKSCVGGKMRLKPSCSWCKDHSKFIENTQLRILLQCYNRLCEFMMSASMHVKWGNLTSGSASGTNMSFSELVQEGAQLNDRYNFSEPPSLRGYSRSTNASAKVSTSTSTVCSSKNGQLNTQTKQVVTVANLINGSNNSNESTSSKNTSLLSTTTDLTCNVTQESPSKSVLNSDLNVSNVDSSNNQLNISHSILTNGSSLIRTPQNSSAQKLKAKRRGCRCGLATPNPGKLTCCGQRCPCYVDGKGCFECKCRGCRNPHKANTNSSSAAQTKSIISSSSVASTSIPVTVCVSTSINPTLTSSVSGTLSPNLCTGSSLLPITRTINIVSSPGSTSDTLLPFPRLEEDPIVPADMSDVEMMES